MSDKLRVLLTEQGAENQTCSLIINAEDYAQHVLLQDKAIPWYDATAYANHLKQTVALLKPQVAVISLDKMIEHELSNNQQLTTAMGEKSRAGYALKILMADERLKAAASALVVSSVLTQSIPIMIQLPSPLQLLYLTARAAKSDTDDEFDADDAENAAIYIADWLRAFKEAGIAGLIFDERKGDISLEAYQPITNTAVHYQWVIGVRRDQEVVFTDPQIAIPVLPATFWTSGDSNLQMAGVIFTEIAHDAIPEQVLDYRERIN